VLLLSTVAFTLPLKRGSSLLLANGYRNLAQVYMYDTGNAAGAESAGRHAIDIYSASINRASIQERLALAETRLLLAKLYESTGRQGRADAEIEQARQLDAGPALPETRPDPVSAARAALTSGDSTAAVDQLNRALAADSALREAYLLLGSIFGAQKNHLQAQELFSRAAARFLSDPVLRYNLALAALNAGHYQIALDNAEAVLEQVPGHPWARKVADEAGKKIRGLSP
jgi:tetratricopeptide (TPR) repeat protein